MKKLMNFSYEELETLYEESRITDFTDDMKFIPAYLKSVQTNEIMKRKCDQLLSMVTDDWITDGSTNILWLVLHFLYQRNVPAEDIYCIHQLIEQYIRECVETHENVLRAIGLLIEHTETTGGLCDPLSIETTRIIKTNKED